MTTSSDPRGVWCAALTPLTASGSPDHARLAAHVGRIFNAGVDGIALFGTTGEGQSFTVRERREGLDALLAAGIDCRRIMPGTACAAVPDTVELTRHAVQAGCPGALVLPPFFFKGVTDEGVYASYARLIDAVGDARLRVYLYHIPQMTSVDLSDAVIERLCRAYPGIIAGIKDSSCNLAHAKGWIAKFPQLGIFVGFEPHMATTVAAGGRGTICGIANIYPRSLRRLYDARTEAERAQEMPRLCALVELLGRVPLNPGFKAIQAALTGDAAWHAVRDPLVALGAEDRAALLAGLRETGLDAARDAAGPY